MRKICAHYIFSHACLSVFVSFFYTYMHLQRAANVKIFHENIQIKWPSDIRIICLNKCASICGQTTQSISYVVTRNCSQNIVLIYLHIHQTIIISSLYSHIHWSKFTFSISLDTRFTSIEMPSSASCLSNALANKLLSRMMKLLPFFHAKATLSHW